VREGRSTVPRSRSARPFLAPAPERANRAPRPIPMRTPTPRMPT